MSSKETEINSTHRERRRQITRTALTGILAKAAMFLPTLLIAWVAVPHLGTERYGVLMTVLSFMGFLNIADLGVGGSLITALSRESGAGNFGRVRQLQANGLGITCGMAILVFLSGLTLEKMEIGRYIFTSSSAIVQIEGGQAVLAFCSLFALTLPLALMAKIQLGLQHGHISNYWQSVASLINFGGGATAVLLGANVPMIIACMMIGTVLCGFANTFFYYKKWPKIRPALSDINWGSLKNLLHESVFYLILQVIFTISYTADTLMVARFLGAEQASVYSLCERLFSIVAVAVSVVTGPLWVAYGDALGGSDHSWAMKTLRVSTLRIFGAACVISLIILVLMQPLINLLSRGHLSAPLSLAFAMVIWRIIESIGGSISVFMFASKANRIVLLTGIITAFVSILLKVTFIPYFGFVAIPAISSLSFFLCSLVPCAIYIQRRLRYQN